MRNMPSPNLIVCSILKKEVQFLCKKNHWTFSSKYLNSSLHIDFDRLENALHKALASVAPTSPNVVVYGTCHPLMDEFIANNAAYRPPVQNCIELLLGADVFTEDLENGAFFLLEEWAHSWEKITEKALGATRNEQMEILHQGHNHLLCLQTPCSGDFIDKAEQISKKINLPLKWRTVSLDIMEKHLKETIHRAQNIRDIQKVQFIKDN